MADFEKLGNAAGLLLGMDVAYNIGSFSLSAPQTTERRIKDAEGASETPVESMGWVWISTWKMLAYTAIPSLMARNPWPLIGGILVTLDLHLSYRYAIYRGMRAKFGGGPVIAGVNGAAADTIIRGRSR